MPEYIVISEARLHGRLSHSMRDVVKALEARKRLARSLHANPRPGTRRHSLQQRNVTPGKCGKGAHFLGLCRWVAARAGEGLLGSIPGALIVGA
jgi:hypothetical protein